MPGLNKRRIAVRRGGEMNNTLKPGEGVCFVYVQVYDDSTDEIMANTEYTLRSMNTGITINGTTDEEGRLRHEFLPPEDSGIAKEQEEQ